MKQLSVFLCMIILALGIDLNPVNLDAMQKETITVTVDGAVENKGEITVDRYASLQQVLEIAEPSDLADTSVFNPQSIVQDKDVIIVPEKTSEDELPRVSINTADIALLCTLEGIGKATAERIIAYRNENGMFQSIEQLMEVKGIGEAKFEKIRERITL